MEDSEKDEWEADSSSKPEFALWVVKASEDGQTIGEFGIGGSGYSPGTRETERDGRGIIGT